MAAARRVGAVGPVHRRAADRPAGRGGRERAVLRYPPIRHGPGPPGWPRDRDRRWPRRGHRPGRGAVRRGAARLHPSHRATAPPALDGHRRSGPGRSANRSGVDPRAAIADELPGARRRRPDDAGHPTRRAGRPPGRDHGGHRPAPHRSRALADGRRRAARRQPSSPAPALRARRQDLQPPRAGAAAAAGPPPVAAPALWRPVHTTIAAGAGFADPSYFNRTFRRRFGTTPTEVRRGTAN